MVKHNRMTATSNSDGAVLLASFRDHIEAERIRLNAEIGTYPGPIPACDAQFNYLLEKRTRLSAELHRVDQLLANCRTHRADAPDIEKVVEMMRQIDTEMTHKFMTVFNIGLAR